MFDRRRRPARPRLYNLHGGSEDQPAEAGVKTNLQVVCVKTNLQVVRVKNQPASGAREEPTCKWCA
jgi:hypothetical protein